MSDPGPSPLPAGPDALVTATVFGAVAALLALVWPFFVTVAGTLTALAEAALLGRWAGVGRAAPPPPLAMGLVAVATAGWLAFFLLPPPLGGLRSSLLAGSAILLVLLGRPGPLGRGAG